MAGKKKRKRVHKIMSDEIDHFDMDCLADYFFLEKDVESDDKISYYYREQTLIVFSQNKRMIRKMVSNGKYEVIPKIDTTYELYKFDLNAHEYLYVWETDSLDELANVMDLFNEYASISWWAGYKECSNAFYSIIDE